MRFAALLPLVSVALLVSACAPTGSDDDSVSTAVTLVVQNDSAIPIDAVHYWDCAAQAEDGIELPLEPDGIPAGGSDAWDLGASGCWNISAEGGGCYVSGTTGDMVEGDSYTWTVTDNDLLCVGR